MTFAWGLGAALGAFALAWAVCVRVRNYGFLDVMWAWSIGVLAVAYALVGDGFWLRRLLLCGIGAAWSLRLGAHIFRRVLAHHPEEDPRYQTLRQAWNTPLYFLLFFELQAIIAVILSLPFLLAAYADGPHWHFLEGIGCALAVLALVGESLADWQMKSFNADPANRGQVCRVGLWKYSRHPNYFFEALIWWGFFLAVLPLPLGWICLICPLMMLWFLLKVTGIPLTEKHSVEKRGDAYREYQRTTSAFIPWFPKSS